MSVSLLIIYYLKSLICLLRQQSLACMQDESDVWPQMPAEIARQIISLVSQRQVPSSPNVSLLLSRISIPQLPKQQDDIPDLKRHLTHIWIFIHNIDDKVIKFSKDYQQFSKIYAKSKYLLNRFSVRINKLPQILDELKRRLDIMVKCYIHAQLVISDEHWNRLQVHLRNDSIGEIIVKSGTQILRKRQIQKNICQQRFDNLFGDKSLKYSGYVETFDDALQLQKKIFNLALSKSKPNFFIINEYETVQSTENLNSFHEILINTKAYLKESLDINTKQMIQASFRQFKQFIYQEQQHQFNLAMKSKAKSEQVLLRKRNAELKILQSFFQQAEKIVKQHHSFKDSDREKQSFYQKVIQLYIEQTIVYRSVNNLCKTITSKEIFMKIAFFCKFLNLAIKQKGKNSLRSIRIRNYQNLYRGAMMSDIQLQSLKKIIGQGYVINLAFVSASFSKQVALKFMRNSRNNILFIIKINPLFWDLQLCERQPYCNYLQYFIDTNLSGVAIKPQQQQVLFNCYNVFKVINYKQQTQMKILELQAFSHLDIIKRRMQGKIITPEQQKTLDVIIRVQKGRDYAQQLKQQGKTDQMVTYLEKVVDSGVDLSTNYTQSFIKYMMENDKEEVVQTMIQKIEEKAESKIDYSIKMAVYQSIKEQYLQSEMHLQVFQEKLKQEQSIKLIKNHRQFHRQSWTELMNKINIKYALAANKEKIGAYDDFFIMIDEILCKNDPDVQASQFMQSIQIWYKFYQYLKRVNAYEKYSFRLLEKQKDFRQAYRIVKQPQIKLDDQNDCIRNFLKIEVQANFFVSASEQQKHKEFVIQENQLRREIEIYKNKFYQRSKLKRIILSHYYEILIKSQRLYILKRDEEKKEEKKSDFIKNLFSAYFQNNKDYFNYMNNVYLREKSNQNYRYQAALFFKDYAKFLYGATLFSTLQQYQKVNNFRKVKNLFDEATKIVESINQKHEQIINIRNTQDTMREEQLFPQKIAKNNSILQTLYPDSCSYSDVLQQQQAIKRANQQKKSRMECAKLYNEKNSILNQNLCYSSILNTTIQIVQRSVTDSDLREKFNYDVQKIANKISSNVQQNTFLKQHTSNAFINYLRAWFQYLKGHYETSMVFLGKSEQILDFKLKATERRMIDQRDLKKKKLLEDKLNIIRQNNQVRIKIYLLKSKICINYKPNIHSLCIRNLNDQQIFISRSLFEQNSALPEIYYYQAYLSFLNQDRQMQKLEKAFKVLLPAARRDNPQYALKKQFLKYYVVKFYMGNKKEQSEALRQIQEIAERHRFETESIKNMKISSIQQYELYCMVKIQSFAIKEGFFLILLMQDCLRKMKYLKSKLTIDNLYQSDKRIQSLFGVECLKYWQEIRKIINIKFKQRILVSYKLFLFYFLYLQFLVNKCANDQAGELFEQLQLMILKLQDIVQQSQRSKVKYNIQLRNNCGFDDKIKIILLHVLKFCWEKWLPGSEIYESSIFEADYKQLLGRFFRS